MKSRLTIFSIASLVLSLISPVTPGVASTAPALVSCVDLQTKVERISKTGECRERKEAKKIWFKDVADSSMEAGSSVKEITICSNRAKAKFVYRVIKPKCAPFQVTTVYSRKAALPAQPLLFDAVSTAHDSAKLTLVSNPSTNPDSPVAFYTVTSNWGDVRRIFSLKNLNLFISGLLPESTYTFSVTATSADGTSKVSTLSRPVTTPVFVPPTPKSTPASTQIAAPSFTVSVSAETKTVNTSLTGYTISSTGGSISSFTIFPSAPAGTTFNSSTGLLTGTPTSTQSVTTYTIAASNASGSATQNFSLTVIAAVADSAISVAAIGGVTVPITGANPVSAVTAANGYTGSVSWSGSPATFVFGTTYTATITLTASSGYTLTGVSANFFTVSGATSVNHSADSGVITAVFPATPSGVANKAMMTTQPAGAVNGAIFTTQPVVRVTDSSGNTNTSFTGNVVATRATGTGTFSGTTTVAAVSGVATFTDLKFTGTAGNHSITFTPTSLTAVTSSVFSLTAGAATQVSLVSSPTSTTSGLAYSTQPRIEIRDVSGNRVTSSSVAVTATVSAGGTIVGTNTATASSGSVSFNNLGVSGTEGTTYVITYSAGALSTTSANAYLSRTCSGTAPYNCQVGDNGTAGGKLFYVSAGGFLCGPTRTQTCHYLEAAPSGWNSGSEPTRTWAQSTPVNYQASQVGSINSTDTATATGVGWGYFNTRSIINQGNSDSATSAAALADAYSLTVGGLVIDDWYLPSKDEISYLVTSQQNTGMSISGYWTSSESAFDRAWFYGLTSANAGSFGDNNKAYAVGGGRFVRPIRAF